MGEEALVNGQHALGANRAIQAIKSPLVQIPRLIVHAAHDGIGRMHDDAHDDAGCHGRDDVQRHAVLDVEIPLHDAFREEIRRQLHRGPETRARHRREHTAPETRDALGFVNLAQTVPRVTILMLRADGQERGVRLETGFDQEERRTQKRAQQARRRAGEQVDGEALVFLHSRVFGIGQGARKDERVDGRADVVVETESTAIEDHLVGILKTKTRVYQ